MNLDMPTYKQLLTVLHHRTIVLRKIREICLKNPELLEIQKLTGEAFTMGMDENGLLELFNKLERQ